MDENNTAWVYSTVNYFNIENFVREIIKCYSTNIKNFTLIYTTN